MSHAEATEAEEEGRIYPNATISIETKPKCGKQGGHVVIIEDNQTHDTNSTVKKFYVKPQDQFNIPSVPLFPSKLADVEELFVYKFFSTISKSPSVHLYVDQERPDCLMIAIRDANTINDEKFLIASAAKITDLISAKVEDMVLVRIFEIIFLLKDLLSKNDNYGWLHESKKLLIIDFSINKEGLMKAQQTSIISMLNSNLPENKRLKLEVVNSIFNKSSRAGKEEIARRAIEPLVNSLIANVDSPRSMTTESVYPRKRLYMFRISPYTVGYDRACLIWVVNEPLNGFISTYPYAFDGRYNKGEGDLKRYVNHIKTRWTEILTYIKLNK